MKKSTALLFFLIWNFLSNASAQSKMILQNYDGDTVPKNEEGNEYPMYLQGDYNHGNPEGGIFTGSISLTGAVSGHCFKAHLTSGLELYAQFNPYTGITRDFARHYCADPAYWKFNTYNRLRFWIKVPTFAVAVKTDGTSNGNVGTYLKTVEKPDAYSDEAGGGHAYHNLNIPNTNTWVQVIINMHPDHFRGEAGGQEDPNQPHPTGEDGYNYFDALTRFYIQCGGTSQFPADYYIDEIEFYQEPNAENDDQIRNISSTFDSTSNKIIVTWFRNKDSNDVKQEVRYAFTDIHASGWNAATPAPDGILTPPGWQGYNGMVYQTNKISLLGKTQIYIAIKPQGAGLFTQVVIPLKFDNQQVNGINNVVSRESSEFFYPNPAKEVIYLDWHGTVSIYDLNGVLLIRKISIDEKSSLDISKLSSGTFILELSNNEEVKVAKLIKE